MEVHILTLKTIERDSIEADGLHFVPRRAPKRNNYDSSGRYIIITTPILCEFSWTYDILLTQHFVLFRFFLWFPNGSPLALRDTRNILLLKVEKKTISNLVEREWWWAYNKSQMKK